MRNVFISYVEEDGALVAELSSALEQLGYSTWFYERDCILGLSYLRQTREAIDQSKSFLLVISSATVGSHQVDKEIVHAHEIGMPILPILHGITFADFRRVRPDWHQAIGAIVGIQLPAGGVTGVIARLTAGLNALGIAPTCRPEGPPDRRVTEAQAATDTSVVVEDAPSSEEEENSVAAVWDDADFDESELQREDVRSLNARFTHEHPATGFLADVVIPEKFARSNEPITIVFTHKLLGATPRKIAVRTPSDNSSPVQYLRLAELIHGYPVVLRLYWLDQLKSYPAFKSLTVSHGAPLAQTSTLPEHVVLQETAGIVVGEKFSILIPPKTPLPCTVTKRLLTKRDNQKVIAVVPALMTAEGTLRKSTKLKAHVLPALAGVAWVECTCRIDPDGRYTTYLRNPLSGMRIEDLIGPYDLVRNAT